VNVNLIHFELELRLDADPIQGYVRDDLNRTVPFAGWLELIAILEGAKSGRTREPTATEESDL
jgi:hypothetical protein